MKDDYISRRAAEERLNRLEREAYHNSVLWPDHVEECREAIRGIPASDVQPVVYCRDCIHRPYTVEPGKRFGFAVETPDRECKCPCYNSDDRWYSYIPDDDFFCGNGERLRAKMGGADG